MSVRTDAKAGFPQPGLDAAREGRTIFGYVNAKTGIDGGTVLTDSTLLQVVQEGKRLVVTSFYMHLSTASDSVTMDFVSTENEDGSGLATALTPLFRIESGTIADGQPIIVNHLNPPLVVSSDDGRAVSVRPTGNDASAALTAGFWGWEEDNTSN